LGSNRAGKLVGLTNCIESVENIIPATNGIFVTLDPERFEQ
jgi:hypothetical protein